MVVRLLKSVFLSSRSAQNVYPAGAGQVARSLYLLVVSFFFFFFLAKKIINLQT